MSFVYGADLRLRQRRAGFSPAALFAGGAQGAWYDPSDLGSMFQDSAGTVACAVNAPVGRIIDKSGRGNHAVQATAAARPMLRQDAAGKYCLEFDGGDDILSASFPLPQPWDRVIALRQISWTSNRRLIGSPGVNAGSIYQSASAPNVRAYSGAFGTEVPGLPVGTKAVLTERGSGAASRMAVNLGAYVTYNAGATAMQGITLGQGGGSVGNVAFYGVLTIGRPLSDAETAGLRAFMAGRAGVVL